MLRRRADTQPGSSFLSENLVDLPESSVHGEDAPQSEPLRAAGCRFLLRKQPQVKNH